MFSCKLTTYLQLQQNIYGDYFWQVLMHSRLILISFFLLDFGVPSWIWWPSCVFYSIFLRPLNSGKHSKVLFSLEAYFVVIIILRKPREIIVLLETVWVKFRSILGKIIYIEIINFVYHKYFTCLMMLSWPCHVIM